MIRLVPLPIFNELRPRAKRFDRQGTLPQARSLPNALIIAGRQRGANDWSVWVVTPFLTVNRFRAWWIRQRPTLPTWQYVYSAERGPVIWLNSLPQKFMLSVREFIVETRKWKPESLGKHLEVLAYVPTTADLQRVIVHDRTVVDGLTAGVSPIIRAGRPGSKFTPSVTDDLRRYAEALHAAYHAHYGKKLVIKPEGVQWM